MLKALRFEQTDRPPFDLMEGCVWAELADHFREAHSLGDAAEIIEYIDPDCRWLGPRYVPPETPADAAEEAPAEQDGEAPPPTYSWQVEHGPLADATSVAEVEAYPMPDPSIWQPGDYQAMRERYPDYALVLGHTWNPLFWGACEAFGMSNALVKMIEEPQVFDAFVRRRQEFYLDILRRSLAEAEGLVDICWLGDDYASQQAMIMSPELWRKRIKPYLAEQVQLARDHGLYVLFHSCGAVRDILPDFIDIGINAHLVFQTTAAGMDAESIAREFGGKLAFYGGIDIQQLLSYGTTEEVAETVRANARAFEKCGGYIVANSHHGVATIRGENLEAMCRAAREGQ